MIHSPRRRWPILFPQTNPELYSAVSARRGWKQVLEFIANCADLIENTRTGNGLLRILLFGAEKWGGELGFFLLEEGCTNREREVGAELILEFTALLLCYLQTWRQMNWPWMQNCTAPLIKIGSFRMISEEIIIFHSAPEQSAVLSDCKQWRFFCGVPEPGATSSPPRERMPLTNPLGFLIKCDWIEPSVPRRRANLYLAYFLFLHLFLFSPRQGVCGGRRRSERTC